VIAIENARLFNETNEALEQQTATSEILRVIARSPTDLQHVLDAMAASAARLCTAYDASILRLEGAVLRVVAHHGPLPPGHAVPAVRGTVNGRAVLDRQAVQVADLQTEREEFPEGSAFARDFGHRTILSVPILREGVAIGTIGVRRTEVQPFTDKQVALLKTFAAQAVIAIENVRLFTELQEKNHALAEAHAQVTEALEQQTATAEILRVISSSTTDLQPVMDAVAEHSTRVCGATDSSIFRLEGEHLRLVARHGSLRRTPLAIGDTIPASPGSVGGRVVGDRRTIHIKDIALTSC
jgi:transcriptional regulator with GAF, ATPase, and Fis domain